MSKRFPLANKNNILFWNHQPKWHWIVLLCHWNQYSIDWFSNQFQDWKLVLDSPSCYSGIPRHVSLKRKNSLFVVGVWKENMGVVRRYLDPTYLRCNTTSKQFLKNNNINTSFWWLYKQLLPQLTCHRVQIQQKLYKNKKFNLHIVDSFKSKIWTFLKTFLKFSQFRRTF